jgi:hypothetical protein
LKPIGLDQNWDLKSPDQWGEPFLLIGDLRSVVYADEPPNH